MIDKCLVIGGSNGIGLSIALQMAQQSIRVAIADRVAPDCELPKNIEYKQVNLLDNDYSFLYNYNDIDALFITAGFGRVTKFENILPKEIDNSFQVNTISAMHVLHHYIKRMQEQKPFYCGVMVSIAGMVVSPLFSLYGATKAALYNGIESLNIELEMSGTRNRILAVCPGSIKGTRFNGGKNDLSQTAELAQEIIDRTKAQETLFIPQYDEIFKSVLERNYEDPHAYGIHSYEYKMQNGRLSDRPQLKIGYLSGTFDLFHIGHLNMLRRAKQYCDYLVVGVHKDASHKGKTAYIPFDERVDIVRNIKYVDKVITSEPEDSDVWTKGIVKYDYLFVGSDYKGSERFNKYEEYFKDKGVKIIYFPYTQGTSSTQLREVLDRK